LIYWRFLLYPRVSLAGILVDIFAGMKRRETAEETSALIRWQFARGEQHLTCAVLAAPTTASYEVATVPLWDVGNAALETFESPGAALHRHAAIAAGLRDAGWTLASYTA
jgi:hypothetical protein